jgi:hypothetical protein
MQIETWLATGLKAHVGMIWHAMEAVLVRKGKFGRDVQILGVGPGVMLLLGEYFRDLVHELIRRSIHSSRSGILQATMRNKIYYVQSLQEPVA